MMEINLLRKGAIFLLHVACASRGIYLIWSSAFIYPVQVWQDMRLQHYKLGYMIFSYIFTWPMLFGTLVLISFLPNIILSINHENKFKKAGFVFLAIVLQQIVTGVVAMFWCLWNFFLMPSLMHLVRIDVIQ